MSRLIPFPLLLLMALVLGLAGGCQPDCEISAHCEIGMACQDGSCVQASCRTSQDCSIEQYCSEERGMCEAGCETDRDCFSFHRCSEGSCVNHGCRSTVLDCGMGEFCNDLTGECYPAAGPYCRECNGDEDCGGGANRCVRVGGVGLYCGVDCSAGQECPRGYSCSSVIDAVGNPVAFQCITACWEL